MMTIVRNAINLSSTTVPSHITDVTHAVDLINLDSGAPYQHRDGFLLWSWNEV